MIEIREETIERVEKILAGVSKGAERALANAMNRGLSRIKAEAAKEVKQVYTVQQKAIKENSTIKIRKASTGSLVGYVDFNSYRIPLYKFSVTPKSPGTERQVYATVKRGEGGTFEDAFIARTGKHTGVFERTGVQGIKSRLANLKEGSKGNKHTEKIQEKMGLSMAQMVRNDVVMENLEKEAQEVVEKRVEQEIYRLLNGYGG